MLLSKALVKNRPIIRKMLYRCFFKDKTTELLQNINLTEQVPEATAFSLSIYKSEAKSKVPKKLL